MPATAPPSGAQVVAALRAVGERLGAASGAGSDPDSSRAAVVQRLARQRPAAERAGAPVDGTGRDAEHGVRQVLRSPGRPMAEPVRREMETAFGTDFSTVRLHENGAAQRSARDLGARAYTAGENVVLGSGATDKHTLAHELAHVVQQRRGAVAGTPLGDGMRISHPDDGFEKAAERTATSVLSGRQVPAQDTPAAGTGPAGDPTPAIQRMVGFEFETNLQVHSNGESLIAKNAHIFDAADASWYITPDGGTLEFVTKAFQEEGDEPQLAQLLTAVGAMAEAFRLLHDMANLASLDNPGPRSATPWRITAPRRSWAATPLRARGHPALPADRDAAGHRRGQPGEDEGPVRPGRRPAARPEVARQPRGRSER